ncbi:hypothetical protein HanIR_Chr16g0842781 [Helianthus annuus]|nr:hypothetical protein HanIR_Chr16g0842781 [Helianthus annuus]
MQNTKCLNLSIYIKIQFYGYCSFTENKITMTEKRETVGAAFTTFQLLELRSVNTMGIRDVELALQQAELPSVQ